MPGSKDPIWLRLLLAVAGAVVILGVGGIWWGGNINAQVAADGRRVDSIMVNLHRIESKLDRLIENLIGP